MTSRTVLNLLLLASVLALGAVAYFQPGVEEQEKTVTLTALRPADVARIRIARADAEHLAFERRNGKWHMLDPVQAPASEVRMEGVLRIAEANSLRRYPAGEVDLAKVGLDQAEVRLFLNDGAAIEFGDVEPLTQARYVRVGDAVHLVEDTGYYHVIGAYTTFLDSALLPDGAVIEGITLPNLKVSRAQDRWQVEPRPAQFSADQVNTLLDEWRHLQSTDLRRYGGGRIRGEITIVLRDAREPLRFGILSRAPELVLARPELGVEYHFPAETAGRLLALPPFKQGDEAPAPQ